MYELYDACTVMFFYRWVVVCIGLTGPPDWHSLHLRNKHIMIDLGTGNNNKMYVLKRTPHTHRLTDKTNLHSNWAMDNKQEVRSICVSFEFLPPLKSGYRWLTLSKRSIVGHRRAVVLSFRPKVCGCLLCNNSYLKLVSRLLDSL